MVVIINSNAHLQVEGNRKERVRGLRERDVTASWG